MGVTLKYETTTCSRCGGSGHYSYCSMYGTTCFKCRGRKTYLSKAGLRAKAKIDEFVDAHFSIAVEALKPGDRIKVEGVHRTVDTVATSGGSRYGVTDPVTKEVTWHDYVTLTFTKPIKGMFGEYSSHAFTPGTRVTFALTPDRWAKVVDYARTLKRMKGLTIVEAA